jgi:hypothetical protein
MRKLAILFAIKVQANPMRKSKQSKHRRTNATLSGRNAYREQPARASHSLDKGDCQDGLDIDNTINGDGLVVR